MLSLGIGPRVVLATEPVDLRRRHDGLISLSARPSLRETIHVTVSFELDTLGAGAPTFRAFSDNFRAASRGRRRRTGPQFRHAAATPLSR